MKRLLISLITVVTALSFSSASAEPTLGAGDPKIAAVYSLGLCQNATQLDCVQSLEIKGTDGVFHLMQYLGTEGVSSYVDNNGNEVTAARTQWSYEDLSIYLRTDLETPEHIILKDGETVALRGGSLRIHVDADDLLNLSLRLKVRTSWLKPMAVQLKVKDSNFEQKAITGGNLWTFEGSGLSYSDYALWDNSPAKNDFSQQADKEEVLFDFYIHHADNRPGYSYFPPVCSDAGYTVQSNNTNATGEPSWNSTSKTLEFGIAAPHLDIRGNLNKGYFKLWVSDKFLDCKFPGNNLTKANSVRVEVLNENGQPQIATTTLQHKNGHFYVFAYGFHFSSPTISITANTVTITCVKGKVLKNVSGTAPKCPVGYKKR